MTVVLLEPELDAHWGQTLGGPLGYYVHEGIVYLTGAIQPNRSAAGSFRPIYSSLPAAVRPSAPTRLTLPIARTGLPLVIDAALTPPTELAATVHPDGTLTLDDELFQYFITAPSVADYWYYAPSVFSPHTPAGPPKYPRYPGPFPCIVALGNASWPLRPQPDRWTPASLAGHLAPSVTDDASGYNNHRERNHLAGELIVAHTPQEVDTSPLPPTTPLQVINAMPLDVAPEDGFAVTTVRVDGELWVAEADAALTLPQPFNYGKVPPGHSPWLVSEVPAPQPPGNTDPWFFSTTNPNNRNYVGYTDALGVGTVDGGLAGETFRVPSDENLPDITFTFDIDALLAMVAPTPDWFALEFIFDWVTGAQDPSSIVGAGFDEAGVGYFTIGGPVAAQVVNGSSLSAGFLVPTAPSYVGADFVPPWQDHPWYPIPAWNFGEIGLIPEPSWLWRTADWPGGSFTFTPHTLPPYFFFLVEVTWVAMTIVPFWEMPGTGFIKAGDAINLNGSGWEAQPFPIPTTIFPGLRQTGLVRKDLSHD